MTKDVRQLFWRAPFTSRAWDLSQPVIVHGVNMGWITDSSSAIFLSQSLAALLYFLVHFNTLFSHFP